MQRREKALLLHESLSQARLSYCCHLICFNPIGGEKRVLINCLLLQAQEENLLRNKLMQSKSAGCEAAGRVPCL